MSKTIVLTMRYPRKNAILIQAWVNDDGTYSYEGEYGGGSGRNEEGILRVLGCVLTDYPKARIAGNGPFEAWSAWPENACKVCGGPPLGPHGH